MMLPSLIMLSITLNFTLAVYCRRWRRRAAALQASSDDPERAAMIRARAQELYAQAGVIMKEHWPQAASVRSAEIIQDQARALRAEAGRLLAFGGDQ